MPRARSHDVELEYETFGSPSGRPLLLVMGFGAQMIVWPAEFCTRLADAGHYVIRFDNRDCGLSSKTVGPPPDMAALLAAVVTGVPGSARAPYSLTEMAADGVAVLAAVGLSRAHIVGASMGGMIAQQMAIEFPEHVLSLTSIMSTTGNPRVGQSDPAALTALMTPPPADRDGAIAAGVAMGRADQRSTVRRIGEPRRGDRNL